jgi:hypothetical protein
MQVFVKMEQYQTLYQVLSAFPRIAKHLSERKLFQTKVLETNKNQGQGRRHIAEI